FHANCSWFTFDLLICRDAKYRELSGPLPYPGHHFPFGDCARLVAIAAAPAARSAAIVVYRRKRRRLSDITGLLYSESLFSGGIIAHSSSCERVSTLIRSRS